MLSSIIMVIPHSMVLIPSPTSAPPTPLGAHPTPPGAPPLLLFWCSSMLTIPTFPSYSHRGLPLLHPSILLLLLLFLPVQFPSQDGPQALS